MEDSSSSAAVSPASSVISGVAEEEEQEPCCRICRGPSEVGNPLRSPCACRGTIKYVHHDCLLQWLNRRKISSCEVCKYKFLYSPIYSKNTPLQLSPHEIVVALAEKFLRSLRILQRLAYLFFVWVLLIPFITHWVWEFAFFKGFSESRSLFTARLTFTAVIDDCLHGNVLLFGVGCAFLLVTYIKVNFPRQPRGAPGLGNRILEAYENGPGNVGGRRGIAKVVQVMKRSLVFLSNWWKVILARLMVHFGVVEIAHLNELVNLVEPFFPFDENEFAVVASNLVFSFVLALVSFCFGQIVTLLQYSYSTAAQVLSSAGLTIVAVLLSVKTMATNALHAFAYFVLYFYGDRTPSQLSDKDSKIFADMSKLGEASNTVSGLVSVELYNEQPNLKSSLSDNTALLIGWMVILSFVTFYLRIVFFTRYVRAESPTVQRLFRIDAFMSRVRIVSTLFRKIMIIARRNFIILKVIVVLVVKVGMFPLMCGWWLDVCTLRMFGQTITESFGVSVSYPLFMSLAHWALGITYIAYVLLHVKLIKQVLLDEVFDFLPEKSKANFYNRIIECPMFKHALNFLLLVGFHGSLMVLLVYFPIRLVNLCVPSAFPLHVSFPGLKFISDVILRKNFIQHVIPLISRFYCPSSTFIFFLRKWLSVVCSLLGLSDFLLPKHENDDVNDVQPRQLAVAIAECSIGRTYEPGMIEVSEDDKGNEGIEAAHLFAFRILILLLLAWMTAIVFYSLMMVVPILLGRTILRAVFRLLKLEAIELQKINDFNSFLFGTCACRAITVSIRYVVEHIQRRGARAFLIQIWQWCWTIFRICSLVFLGLFAMPTFFGILLHHVVAIPMQLPLPTLFVYCGLGWIFLTTLAVLVIVDLMHSVDERWVVKLRRLLTDGPFHMPSLWILREILVPIMMLLFIALCTSYMVARLVSTLFGYPIPVNSVIHHFVWPVCFVFGVLWLFLQMVRVFAVYLHNKIRDDRYRMGQSLQDYSDIVLN